LFLYKAIYIMTRTLTINVPEGEVEFLTRVLNKLGVNVEESYDPEFVKKVKKARSNARNGEYVTIKDTKNIWESILSE